MIYIFKSVQGLCSLPGLACKACGDLCRQINCLVCVRCCHGLGAVVTAFFSQPLSTFVVISMVMSGTQLYLSYDALTAWKSCTFPDSAFLAFKTFLLLQVVFALLNLAFAFFFQRQVWKMILALLRTDEHKPRPAEPQPAAKTGRRGQKKRPAEQDVEANPEATTVLVTKATVQLAFRKVFLEDFVVLFFFLAFICIFVISIMSMPWFGEGDACPAPSTASMGLSFFLVAFVYTFLYYCCGCCAASVEVEKSQLEEQPLDATRPEEQTKEPAPTSKMEAPQVEEQVAQVAESQLNV